MSRPGLPRCRPPSPRLAIVCAALAALIAVVFTEV